MKVDLRTLTAYVDAWLEGLDGGARTELAALVRASGGDAETPFFTREVAPGRSASAKPKEPPS